MAFGAAALIAVASGCADNELVDPSQEADHTTVDDEGPALAGTFDSEYGVPPTTRTYEITIENLTADTGDGGSQVFSPPVFATHSGRNLIYRLGGFASPGLAGVAEDALNDGLVKELAGNHRTHDAFVGEGGPIFPGQSATYTVQTIGGFRRLSTVWMLVNTNDAFSGLNGIQLPRAGTQAQYVFAYDAGSEVNTELMSDIPGPCCGNPGSGPDERKRIRKHEGITGRGDLDPNKYGFEGAVAKITIKRLAPAYEIKLENLTPVTVDGGSQVFSPPVLATHSPRVKMFRVGRKASDELAAIAEDGMNGPMLDLLGSSGLVYEAFAGDGPVFPGDDATYEVEAPIGFRRLSMVFMLVNTNDAFSGVDRVRLPAGGRAAYYLNTYDAGSEVNTELASDIPGPCCGSPGAGTASDERIRHHPGILGIGDLDVNDYGWDDPAAKLTITRTR